MIISIDGPAGSGKSSTAKALSEKLGFVHFNSGSLYRAVTVFLKKDGFNFNLLTPDCEIKQFKLDVKFENGVMNVFVNNLNCTPHLRDNEISVLTPKVSINKFVRTAIDNFQRQFATSHNIVVDGRDIGSHVFPNADFKFYLDCSILERAKRRFKEEKEKGNKISLNEIEKQIAARDETDRQKKYAPLVVPKGAIIIDSSNLTLNEVVELMLKKIKEKF